LTLDELAEWTGVIAGLVDGFDRRTLLLEQFAGYHKLEEIDLEQYQQFTVPIDVVLGHDYVQRSKAIKQADVLMALYLLWNEFAEEVHEANLRYYEPRTGHGSSLSPGIHAAIAARLGEVELAERHLRRAAAVDLGDQMGNASGGVHLAALGSLWQAAVMGFGGVELLDDELRLRPRLPAGWQGLRFALCWRGRILRINLRANGAESEVALERGEPLLVTMDGNVCSRLTSGNTFKASLFQTCCDLCEEEQP
jgi:trehalose/maltose hydrolase-like predicted phosphorylase